MCLVLEFIFISPEPKVATHMLSLPSLYTLYIGLSEIESMVLLVNSWILVKFLSNLTNPL